MLYHFFHRYEDVPEGLRREIEREYYGGPVEDCDGVLAYASNRPNEPSILEYYPYNLVRLNVFGGYAHGVESRIQIVLFIHS